MATWIYIDTMKTGFKNKSYPSIRLLEIGVKSGQSLESWTHYFGSSSEIDGLRHGEGLELSVILQEHSCF